MERGLFFCLKHMTEDEVKIFIGGSLEALSEEEFKKHRAIAEHVSILVAALEGTAEYAEKAATARRLVQEKKAVLWSVADISKVPYIAAPGYVRPDPQDNGLMPAVVLNRLWSPLTELPSTWDEDTRNAVVTAVINLDSAYQAGLRFTIYRLLDQDDFFDILGRGDPSRQHIIPLWDLMRR